MDNFILSVAATPYQLPIVVTGGMPPVSCVVSGEAPPGLSFNGFCAASGTPVGPGTYTFTATATDSLGNSASANITASVPSSVVAVQQAENPNATAGWPYNWTHVVAYGGTGTYTWAVTSGALPSGLSLLQFGGFMTIAGTPATAGSATFSVTATDTNRNASNPQSYTLVMNPAPSLITSSLPGYTAGTMYYAPIGASGGTPPYWCSVTGALPAGFVMDAAACEIYGVTSAAGPFPVTVTAFDSNGYGVSAPFTLSGSGGTPPTLLSTPSSVALTGTFGSVSPVSQSVQLNASGAAIAFTAASNAQWLTASPAAGTTPSTLLVQANPAGLAAGTYQGVVVVTSLGAANSPYSIPVTFTVVPATGPGFTLTVNPTASTITQGQTTTFLLTVLSQGGFSAPTALAVLGLPRGDKAGTGLSPATVTPPANGQATSTLTVVTGSTTTTGTFSVTLQASSGGLPTANFPVTLTVNPAP
jgi:hypothetical protein